MVPPYLVVNTGTNSSGTGMEKFLFAMYESLLVALIGQWSEHEKVPCIIIDSGQTASQSLHMIALSNLSYIKCACIHLFHVYIVPFTGTHVP